MEKAKTKTKEKTTKLLDKEEVIAKILKGECATIVERATLRANVKNVAGTLREADLDHILKRYDARGKSPRDSLQERLKRLTPKSKDEIVDSGTAKEVGYLFSVLANSESNVLPPELRVTPIDKLHIMKRLTDEELITAEDIVLKCFSLYALKNRFRTNFFLYQKEIAYLGRYIAEWNGYRKMADVLTALYADTTDKATFLKDVSENVELHRSTLHFDEDTQRFRVNTGDGEGMGLKTGLLRRSEYAKTRLTRLKAIERAMLRFMKEQRLSPKVFPLDLEVFLDDVKSEEFCIRMEIPQKYFRSTLNINMLDDMIPTEEEIEQALIPDYYEIEISEIEMLGYKVYLDSCMKAWSKINFIEDYGGYIK